jgi:primary-amine oxidase
MMLKKIMFLLLSLCFLISKAKTQREVMYPLDPLTSDEIKKVVDILKSNHVISGQSFFNVINLKEPPKKKVLEYKPGMAFRREAFASFYDDGTAGMTEAIVDLNPEKIISVKHIPNVIGMGLEADSIAADILKNDPEWVAALKRRGISIDSVTHRSIFTADFGIAPIGHREQLVIPRLKKNKVDIEGLLAYTDFTDKKVLKIVDEENRFSGKTDLDYFDKDSLKSDREGPKPLIITQPEGASFQINGHEVTWQNWRLRYGIDNREGLVIYDVRYVENGKERKVMYRGSMPEMVVPYGSPDLLQASYNFFDAGEYRLGQATARSLTFGADAPENAAYLPATLIKESGAPFVLDSAVAIYEQNGGTLWRHENVSRRATDLAIKYYATIENYDYGFTWIFKENGTIQVDVELTGIVEIRGVHRTNEMDPPDKNDYSYEGKSFGTLVHPHVEATNHQHFFVFRLDMDIDGDQNNSVMEMNTVALPESKTNPFSNAFVVEHTSFKTEKEGERSINYESNRSWNIINNTEHTKYGQHVGYMLMPGEQAKPFVLNNSLLRKKAGFLNHQVWITQYAEDEIFPAGKYPASNKVYQGLPEWTSKDRAINNNDIVVWYVAGITHIVRPEDWPVMPVHHMGFSLMPFGFFSSNPTIGIPYPEFLKNIHK